MALEQSSDTRNQVELQRTYDNLTRALRESFVELLDSEVDILVAVGVLGWVPPASEVVDIEGRPMYPDREPLDHSCRGECFHSGHSLRGTERAPFRKRGNPLPPSCTTDIAVAFDVVAHMERLGWMYALGSAPNSQYVARFLDAESEDILEWREGAALEKTITRAIGLAAWRALHSAEGK